MMPFANIDPNEILSFFAVLIRFTTMLAVLPIFGENSVPAPVKILLGLVLSVVLYPMLVANQWVRPADAQVWAQSASTMLGTIALEVVFGLCMGYVTRILFDAVLIAGDLVGTLMGFSAANMYDPLSNSQSQVISKILYALAILLFLALDAHHIMLNGVLKSYQIVGIGKVQVTGSFAQMLVTFTGDILKIAIQLSAPMAVVFFGINIIYGILAKAMPQMNVLVLSFSVSALLGFFVLTMSLPAFQEGVRGVFVNLEETLTSAMQALRG